LRDLLEPYTGLYLDYSWVRRRIPRLDLRPYMSLEGYEWPVSMAVDSSDVRVCGRRWAVETAFSTYKKLYEEHTMSRNMENIERELKAKSIHIQHTDKNACEISKGKQKKSPER